MRKKGIALLVGVVIGAALWILLGSSVYASSAPDYNGALKALVKAVDRYDASVDLKAYRIPKGGQYDLSLTIKCGHPQYFYYAGMGTLYTSGNLITKADLLYYNKEGLLKTKAKMTSGDWTAVKNRRSQYEAKVASIISRADSKWSDFEKILYANEYLASNCVYGGGSGNYAASAYGALVEGEAVCEGYSVAFQDLMNRLGVPCRVVLGDNTSIISEGHAWNLVKFGGKWYQLDVTWSASQGGYCLAGNVDHDYFLKSGGWMKEKDHRYEDYSFYGPDCDWTKVTMDSASDTRFDGGSVWSNAGTPFVYYNKYWYALINENGEQTIRKYSADDTGLKLESTVLTLENDMSELTLPAWLTDWTCFYRPDYYTGFASCGKYLYFANVQKIFSLNLESGAVETAYELSAAEKKSGVIGGIRVDFNGKLSYALVTGYSGQPDNTVKSRQVHTHSLSYKTTKAATLAAAGARTVTCKDCGQSYTEVIAKKACKKNQVYTVGSYKYKIISPKTNGKGTVAFAGLAKSVTKVSVSATVKISGAKFMVTQIGANALRNKTKVTAVTVGSNVTAIGAQAFYGTKKLKTITVKSTKITKVGSNALKNIYEKAKIKVPKSRLAKYQKLFKKKGQKSTVKVVRS